MSSPQRQEIYVQFDSPGAGAVITPGGIQMPTPSVGSSGKAGKGALRDRTCSECLKTIPMANVLRCKGCKIALYCNKNCQRANWDNHKKVCSTLPGVRNEWDEDHKLVLDRLAQQHLNASKKELHAHEQHLARTWFDVHQLSLHKAALAALQEYSPNGDLRAFRLYGQCVFFLTIRPRRDIADNPATAFYITTAYLRTFDDDDGALEQFGVTARLADQARGCAAWARDHGTAARYVAFMPVVCTYTALSFYHGVPVYAPLPRPVAVPRAPEGRWLATLKAMVLRGHILGPPPMDWSGEGVGAKVGRAVRIGPVYGWAAIDPEEAKRLGYPEYPAIVG